MDLPEPTLRSGLKFAVMEEVNRLVGHRDLVVMKMDPLLPGRRGLPVVSLLVVAEAMRKKTVQ